MITLIRAWRRALLAATLMLATAGPALAGMDVSLEREFQSLEEIQRRIEELPAYRESTDLEQQIQALWERFDALSGRNPEEIALERETLRKQIETLQGRLGSLQKTIVDFRAEVSRGEGQRFFPDVQNRVAVFTFDDPYATGLGDAVSFLLSKKILFSTRVSSFAIVNYAQGAAPQSSGDLAYFDRVDALTRDQAYRLAVWGRLSRSDQGIRIDSFLQVPADTNAPPYVREVRLPEAMGGGTLTARLKPDRILVQGLDINPGEAETLGTAADEVVRLRAEPSASAAVTAHLGEDRAYRIVDSAGDWVQLRIDSDSSGWTSVDGFCDGACRELMKVATFANDIVALASGQTARPVPEGLTREAEAMAQQLAALAAIPDDPRSAVAIAEEWTGERSGGPPPAGAGFANVLAVARIAAELERARAEQPLFDEIMLDEEAVRAVARALAAASVADPGDVDVLDNLAVLFAYLGDERRQALAMEIAAGLRAR